MSAPRAVPEPRITEAEWQKAVCELLDTTGWQWDHTYRGRVGQGAWRTNTTKKGMPDLFIWGHGEHFWAELKTDTGKLSPAQNEVLSSLATDGGCEINVWRPSDWPAVVKRLTR